MNELFPVTNKPDEFELFWSQYPRKVGKLAAQRALKKALKRSKLSEIINGLKRHKFSDDPQYIPYPATWLNAGRWMDESACKPAAANVMGNDEWNKVWEHRLKGYKPGGFWSSHWGSRPEHDGTDIPRHILDEWRRGR